MKLLTSLVVAFAIPVNTFALTIDSSVEKKIVEIHMYRKVEVQSESKKKKGSRVEVMPLSYGVCSGSFINEAGSIITAKHCVEGFDELEVITSDQQHYRVDATAKSAAHDVALVHINRFDTPYFTLASGLTRGETVYALGSPLGITNTLSKGIIAKLDGDTTLVDLSVLPGNSGCPLINEKGELAGVVTAGFIVMLGTTHLNLVQSLDVVRFFLLAVFGGR